MSAASAALREAQLIQRYFGAAKQLRTASAAMAKSARVASSDSPASAARLPHPEGLERLLGAHAVHTSSLAPVHPLQALLPSWRLMLRGALPAKHHSLIA